MVAVITRPAALASWLFCAGMVMLGVERLMDYQCALAAGSAEINQWLRRSLLVKSFVPGVWLGLSLVYARGNPSEFLSRWKWVFLAAMLVPAGLVLGFPERMSEVVEPGTGVSIRLLPAGKVWVITVLMVTLAILVNFENTFRASVGMTRWRIKYLILGAALIFGVKLYALSQKLLFSGYDPELANLTLVAVILGCGLIVVGQVRSSFGEFDIYPSRAVLQGSFTVILAGGYFLIVGFMAQWVALLGGGRVFRRRRWYCCWAR